jgi:hypothetical protein
LRSHEKGNGGGGGAGDDDRTPVNGEAGERRNSRSESHEPPGFRDANQSCRNAVQRRGGSAHGQRAVRNPLFPWSENLGPVRTCRRAEGRAVPWERQVRWRAGIFCPPCHRCRATTAPSPLPPQSEAGTACSSIRAVEHPADGVGAGPPGRAPRCPRSAARSRQKSFGVST